MVYSPSSILSLDLNTSVPLPLSPRHGASHPQARPLIAENFEAWSIAITALIESFADRLPRDVRPATLARHVQATMEGAIVLARAYHSFEPFDQAMHQLRDYVERLLRDGAIQFRPSDRAAEQP